MKIFEIIADSDLGGAPIHLLTLCRGLDQFCDLTLICPPGWLSHRANWHRIKTIELPFFGLKDLNSILKLRQIIRRQKPDLIHFHGQRAGWFGMVATLGLATKTIYTEHLFTPDYHLESKYREKLQRLGLRLIYRHMRQIIAPSRAVKKFITNFGIKPKKVTIIPHGLSDQKSNKIFQKTKTLKFGFIGSLNYNKGIATLIEAMVFVAKQLPNAQLEIIGDGPQNIELQLLSRNVKIDIQTYKFFNIKFLGSKINCLPFLKSWQFIVIPSLSESFCQVVLEAAMVQKPAIASRAGALPEIILDHETGLLVPPKNPQKLAEAIVQLLKNPKLTQKMGSSARKNFLANYTFAKMIKNYQQFYQKFNESR